MLRHNVCRSLYKAMSKSKNLNRNIQTQNRLSNSSPVKYISNKKNYSRGKEALYDDDDSIPFYKPEFCPDGFSQSASPFYKSPGRPRGTPTTANSDSFETDSITSGISDIKLMQSLSSSPTWSDDTDFDSSKKVQDELELMDRVLRGIEPIPLHYDMEEYKQWMETFPNISLFGKVERGPFAMRKNEDETGTVKIFKPDLFVTNNRPMTDFKQYKEEIKKAVIHNIYENLTIRLNETPTKTSMLKSDSIGDFNRTQTYLSSCLNNSPFESIKKKYEKNSFTSRQVSREDKFKTSPTFESLPLMFDDTKKKRFSAYDKYKTSSLNGLKMKKSRNSILLPPIEPNKFNTTQFRSTSAMPTYASLLSSKSIKLESKIGARCISRRSPQI